jgi:hypothetical protein
MKNYELVYRHDNIEIIKPDLTENISTDEANRCIKIKQNINLNNIINEYKRK